MVDARLPDGSRVNAIAPPLCLTGVALTIRRFAARPLQLPDLLAFGSLTPAMADFLAAAARARLNILISGGTGSGKTTLLAALAGCIPPGERLVLIEDMAEIRLDREHVISLEARRTRPISQHRVRPRKSGGVQNDLHDPGHAEGGMKGIVRVR